MDQKSDDEESSSSFDSVLPPPPQGDDWSSAAEDEEQQQQQREQGGAIKIKRVASSTSLLVGDLTEGGNVVTDGTSDRRSSLRAPQPSSPDNDEQDNQRKKPLPPPPVHFDSLPMAGAVAEVPEWLAAPSSFSNAVVDAKPLVVTVTAQASIGTTSTNTYDSLPSSAANNYPPVSATSNRHRSHNKQSTTTSRSKSTSTTTANTRSPKRRVKDDKNRQTKQGEGRRPTLIAMKVLKPTRESKLGIRFWNNPQDGVLEVASLAPPKMGGLLSSTGTPLLPGDRILQIDHHKDCSRWTSGQAAAYLRTCLGWFSILVAPRHDENDFNNYDESGTAHLPTAAVHIFLDQTKNPKLGLGIGKEEEPEKGGGGSAAATAAAAAAATAPGGDENQNLILKKFRPEGLLGDYVASSILQIGDRVLTINGISAKGLAPAVAIQLLVSGSQTRDGLPSSSNHGARHIYLVVEKQIKGKTGGSNTVNINRYEQDLSHSNTQDDDLITPMSPAHVSAAYDSALLDQWLQEDPNTTDTTNTTAATMSIAEHQNNQVDNVTSLLQGGGLASKSFQESMSASVHTDPGNASDFEPFDSYVSDSTIIEPTFISVSLYKPTKDTKLGISLINDSSSMLALARIIPGDGLFNKTPLKSGLHLLSINHIECHDWSAQRALNYLRVLVGPIYLVFQNPFCVLRDSRPADFIQATTLIQQQINIDDDVKNIPPIRVGLSFVGSEGRALYLSKISPRGHFANSVLAEHDEIVQINDMKCTNARPKDAVQIIQQIHQKQMKQQQKRLRQHYRQLQQQQQQQQQQSSNQSLPPPPKKNVTIFLSYTILTKKSLQSLKSGVIIGRKVLVQQQQQKQQQHRTTTSSSTTSTNRRRQTYNA